MRETDFDKCSNSEEHGLIINTEQMYGKEM